MNIWDSRGPESFFVRDWRKKTLNLPLPEHVNVKCSEFAVVCTQTSRISAIQFIVFGEFFNYFPQFLLNLFCSRCMLIWEVHFCYTSQCVILLPQLHHLDGTQSINWHQIQYLFTFMPWTTATITPASLNNEEMPRLRFHARPMKWNNNG